MRVPGASRSSPWGSAKARTVNSGASTVESAVSKPPATRSPRAWYTWNMPMNRVCPTPSTTPRLPRVRLSPVRGSSRLASARLESLGQLVVSNRPSGKYQAWDRYVSGGFRLYRGPVGSAAAPTWMVVVATSGRDGVENQYLPSAVKDAPPHPPFVATPHIRTPGTRTDSSGASGRRIHTVATLLLSFGSTVLTQTSDVAGRHSSDRVGWPRATVD